MPTHQSAASAINLVDEENQKVPWPVEAAELPDNAMDEAVTSVISRIEQTFGARRFSAADQDRHVSAGRLQLPHNMIDGTPQSKLGTTALIGCGSPHGDSVGAPHSKSRSMGACLLSTGLRSWVHAPAVPPFLARSGQRPSVPYLHQRPAAPYLHWTPAVPFAWVAPSALSAAHSMPMR